MHGEGVRHPTTSVENNYLPSSVLLCLLSMDVGFKLNINVPIFRQAIYQEWYMQFDFIWFCLDFLFHFSLSFVFIRVLGNPMVGCT